MNFTKHRAIAIVTACALTASTLAAVADDEGQGSRRMIRSASMEVGPQSSAILLQVPDGERFIVTQFCRVDGMAFPGFPGMPPTVEPPRAAFVTTDLGKVATDTCRSFEPGLAVEGGDSILCDNPNLAGRVCTVTGFAIRVGRNDR